MAHHFKSMTAGVWILILLAGCSSSKTSDNDGTETESDSASGAEGDGDTDADGDGDTDADSDVDTDADTDADTDTARDTEGQCTGEDYTGVCQMDSEIISDTINRSCLVNWERESLCRCLPTANESWRGGLEHLFQNGDAEDIAQALTELVECCDYGDMSAMNGEYTDEGEQALIDGELCNAIILLYMAVPFE